MKFCANLSSPPLGAILTSKFVANNSETVEWGKETLLQVQSCNLSLDTGAGISRYLAKSAPELELYGGNALQKTEVDHWLSFSLGPLACSQEFEAGLQYLENVLNSITYLVGSKLTIADLNVFSALILNQNWIKISESGGIYPNTNRWFKHIGSLPNVRSALADLPEEVLSKTKKEVRSTEPKEEGKFVELPGAEMGKVVVRFPPEASGYLHIGHAKAALLNWYYRELFNGTFIMRFDDTNPDKEKVDFEKVILEDLKMLEIYPDKFTRTSDHFPLLLELCEKLLRSGAAYIDDTPPEQMKSEREARLLSRNRANLVDKNFSMWTEMLQGSEFGQRCCVRAKIDMASDNGCMRDPTIYRCKSEPHPMTGTKYRVYPTYDFACPVVDSIEGVTHALRTMEYHDRDDQYYWFIEALQLRKPYIWEYSRLNMMNTVLSKRKLTWFVEQGLVESWEDPRFPTVRGVLRRGMTVQGLKQFIIAQGSSRSVVQMEWDKIWAFNKKVIDPIAPRLTALEAGSTVLVNVKGAKSGTLTVPLHPKNADVGKKTIAVGPRLLISAEDAILLKEGSNATFINWGNLLITRLNRDGSNRVTSVDAELNLSNTDFKKTLKLTWLAEGVSELTQFQVLYYDHIITKPVLGKEEDFKQFINNNSKKSVAYIGDTELSSLKAGTIIQLQRIGYFRVDLPAGNGRSLVLIHIPDGSSKSPFISSVGSQPAADGSDIPLTSKEIENIAVQWRQDRLAFNSSALLVTQVPTNTSGNLTDRIAEQGNKVRQLKANKASKAEVDAAVKELLGLKQEFKSTTGQEWKPGADPTPVSVSASGENLSGIIVVQGDKVRQLKASKASKADIDIAVQRLLALKKEYKDATGQEWKPTQAPVAAVVEVPVPSGEVLSSKVAEQGDKVRQLKANKSSKVEIEAAVQQLLALKKEYKDVTGQEWKPTQAPIAVPVTVVVTSSGEVLSSKVAEQGDKVRQLKANKSSKAEIEAAVQQLLALKSDYKATTGKDWKPTQTPVAVEVQVTAVGTSSGDVLSAKVAEQGDKVRQLKANKSSKAEIEAAVQQLLALKSDYKASTGQDWKPPVTTVPASSGDGLFAKVAEQGDKVRQLKGDKASKEEISAAVKILLALKEEYKAATGQDWKPAIVTTPAPVATISVMAPIPANSGDISAQITEQGNKVRELKAQKASKKEVEDAVKVLLTLKDDFKKSTGQDWKPGNVALIPNSPPTTEPKTSNPGCDLSASITAQGDKVRELKIAKAEKSVIEAQVQVLLALKAEFKTVTGQDWKPSTTPQRSPGVSKEKSPTKKSASDNKRAEKGDKEKSVEKEDEKGLKKQTRLGLEAKKEENLPDWYSQVITKGELIEYYDVSGCYILRPWAFAVWESIQSFLDKEIKKLGVVNAYFPMFVSRSVLEREKAHIADFAPEVAWVTKSGDSELAEHIAIRPTSETAMYPAYSKWIQSHRDLPLRLNQWNNVVRWEFKHPQPFLRTREFLWQEGHTAFATYKEAEEEVYQILDLYARVYTDLLAVPVVKGRKTEKEKFAGGDYTTTVEAFISASGRGIQGGTSHHLGHNFAKMFDITVEDPESKEKMYVYQNSWGLTTRTIGVMIMVHADNQGLVMPPAVSALQVVIVPCGVTASLPEDAKLALISTCKQLDSEFRAAGIRSKLDERDNYSPGWKFNHWELKGVPLRVELGPKDLEKKQLVAVRRDTGAKLTVSLTGAAAQVSSILNTVQSALLATAEADLKAHTKIVTQWADFCTTLDAKNIILAPFCEGIQCEDNIKKDSARDQDLEPGAPAMGAKSLCIPFEQPAALKPNEKCIHPACSSLAKSYTLFGRSY